MATIHSNATDGTQSTSTNSDWDTVHDSVGSSSPDTNDTTNNFAIQASYFNPPRNFYVLRRTFLDFDTSVIGTSINDGTIQLYITGTFYDDMDIIFLKSGHDPSDATEDWYSTWLTGLGGTISGWSNTDSEIVPYTSECTTTGTGTGYHSCTLNGQALRDIRDNDVFKVVVMNYDFDYLDVEPPLFNELGIYFRDDGTARAPKIVVGGNYNETINGIVKENIANVNGVPLTSINKVNGV